MSKTLNDFLSSAGIRSGEAKTAATAPAAAPAKTATGPGTPAKVTTPAGTIPPSQPSTIPAGGHQPREKRTDSEKQDTGKTAHQLALAQYGIEVADAKTAEAIYGTMYKQAEAVKIAELHKQASEVRAQGALMYQGMMQESVACKLAFKEASLEDAQLIANITNVPLEFIVKRAEQIGGAMTAPALVGGNLGSAARTDNSVVMRKGEECRAQVQTREVEAIAGTRMPVTGVDDKLVRMTDVFTLPGNPGVNHGQVVDQGRAG